MHTINRVDRQGMDYQHDCFLKIFQRYMKQHQYSKSDTNGDVTFSYMNLKDLTMKIT